MLYLFLLGTSFRPTLWINNGTFFSAIARCDYTLSMHNTWIKSCESLRRLVKGELIRDFLIGVITYDIFLGDILIWICFLGTSCIDKAPNRNWAYTHNDRCYSHQHDLHVVGGTESLKFGLEAQLLKHAIERVEGVLGVRDLCNDIKDEIHLWWPLEVKSLHQRNNLDVVG